MQNQSELSRTDSKICEVTYCHLDFKKSTEKSEELRAERKDATSVRGAGRAIGTQRPEQRRPYRGTAGVWAPG